MPDLPQPEKRKPLTRMQFATLILQQDGLCGCGCKRKLQADRIIDEHVQRLDALGSNDLSNRALWDVDCSKAKTSVDNREAKKGARIRRKANPETRKAPSMRSGQKLQGRPFQKVKRPFPKSRGFGHA